MGKKIFVSYKYADDQVKNLEPEENSTVRDYVDKFEEILDSSDNIYKGESDGEDLSSLTEEEIWEKLKDRIYDSSVTVIFISPGMKETEKLDKEQWIPWEVSYSLKETSRKNKEGDPITSHTNAMVVVVLPDENGSYDYYFEMNTCCISGCTTHKTNMLFKIIKNNKFNKIKNVAKHACSKGMTVWRGECSYIKAVKWCNFIKDYQTYINNACNRQENIDDYEIDKEIE